MDVAHPPKLLYAARKHPNATLWTPEFIKRLEQIGELTVLENAGEWSDADLAKRIRQADVVLTDWSARPIPLELADDPGKLRYICHLQGSVRHWVARRFIEQGIQVTNWGDLPANGVAEGALTLLLAVLKRVIPQTDHIRAGGWALREDSWMGTLHGLRVGVYGLGVIGRRFTELVPPFNPRLSGFDPFIQDWPTGVARRDSLESLCDDIDCLVVAAGLTDETRSSLTTPHFAALPDGGIVINVARGGIIDQPALFAELERGRLRAGLDVLDTDGEDWLPKSHPGRSWPNLLLSAHAIGRAPWNKMMLGENELGEHQEIALRNLERFVSEKPLLNAFDLARYDLST